MSNYETTGLRKGIDYIAVGVCCIVHDGNGRVLMMKRSNGARDEHGTWDICGGGIEFGESINDAIVRELEEELHTVPLKVDFVEAFDAHREINGNKTHWVQLMYSILVNPKTVELGEPDKFDEIGWFTNQNLPSPRHSQFAKWHNVATQRGIIL